MGGPVLRIGIDIGSTTVKVVLLDDQDRIVKKLVYFLYFEKQQY